MFAFAIFDQATGSLFLARDQFGIKPLHYMRRKDGVVFASELKALVSAFGRELHVSTDRHSWPQCSTTGFRTRCAAARRRETPAGHLGRVPPRRHPECRPVLGHRRRGRGRRERATGDLREVIEESVNAHLVADVPVSSFLSGGLDSSIVTVLAKQANPQIDAYTITFRAQDQRLEAMPDDARLRPEGRATLRDRAARDRTESRRRRPLAEDGGCPRRADRRPGRHQHAAHVGGGPSGRGQGALVGDGCGRALRGVSQTPGLRARRPVSENARSSSTGRPTASSGVCR